MKNSAIILTIDRLGARALGPYGNTWYQTPHFNRLAAESVLYENIFSRDVDSPAHSFGWFANAPDSPFACLQAFNSPKAKTILVSDDETICDAGGQHFDEAIRVWTPEEAAPAEQWTETGLAGFFSAAAAQIEALQTGQLLWLHSRGMSGVWDAPAAMRRELAEDGDPAPPDFLKVPEWMLDLDFDPDEILGYQQAYGAQVHVLDYCLGVILDQLNDMPASRVPLICLTSPRGFSMGEHRIVGSAAPSVYDEVLHVPLLVRWPDARWRASRCLDLGEPILALRQLVDWLAADPSAKSIRAPSALPDRSAQWIVSRSGELRAVRTHSWKLIENGFAPELYAKPDDRCDQNDVANRCREIAAELRAFLIQAERGQLAADFRLAEQLAFGHG